MPDSPIYLRILPRRFSNRTGSHGKDGLQGYGAWALATGKCQSLFGARLCLALTHNRLPPISGNATQSGMKWIPNLLTISRVFFAFCVIAGIVLAQRTGQQAMSLLDSSGAADAQALALAATRQQLWYQFALLAFISGALTDFLDGYLARMLNAQSRFGVWLDPIADKLLVGAALVGICMMLQTWLVYIPAALILARDIFMTWFRTTPRGRQAVEPSALAKWKTAAEMLAIFAILLVFAMSPASSSMPAGGVLDGAIAYGLLALLWIAAALSLWTGWQYVNGGRR